MWLTVIFRRQWKTGRGLGASCSRIPRGRPQRERDLGIEPIVHFGWESNTPASHTTRCCREYTILGNAQTKNRRPKCLRSARRVNTLEEVNATMFLLGSVRLKHPTQVCILWMIYTTYCTKCNLPTSTSGRAWSESSARTVVLARVN